MKKLLFFVALVVVTTITTAQITDIYPFKKGNITDSTLVINNLYAGTLSGTCFSVDSLSASMFVNIRFGAMMTYSPVKWFSVKTWAMYHADAGEKSWNLQQYWIKLMPVKKLSLEIGSMATLVTEQRPLPITGNGHFETWTEAQIPGMALNTKLKYQFTKNFQLAGGVAVRNKIPEYSGRITFGGVKVSGWYSNDTIYGTALTLNTSRVYDVFVFKQDVIANFLSFQVSKKFDLFLYSDTGYNLDQEKLVRGEWGILKCFGSKYASGLIGLGYQNETKTVNGYLFLHL
jgi:hypothetical protein